MAHSIPNGMGAIFITGPRRIGVSTMAQLLHTTLSGKRGREVESVESGDLITAFGYNLRDRTGIRIRNCIDNNQPVESELMVEILNRWLAKELQRNPDLKTVIVSGAPRTGKQTRQMVSVVGRPLFVNLGCDNLQNLIATVGLKSFHGELWDIYIRDLLPSIKGLKPKQVVHLDRTAPLKDRLVHVLKSIQESLDPPVSQEIVTAAMKRIRNPFDRIHQQLNSVDPPKRQELVLA